MSSPTLNQEIFRFYDDDGTDETDSTALANADIAINRDLDTNTLVRFSVSNTGTMSSNNLQLQLQRSHQGGAFGNVTASSTVARMFASTKLTEGNSTTERLAGAQTFDTTNGGQEDNDGLTAANTLATSGEIEVVYCIQIRSADVSGGQTVDFRLVDGAGGTLDNYNTPTVRITANAGAISLTVQDGDHLHVPDTPALTQHYGNLTVSDGDHVHAPDTPALTQHNVLAVSDGDHVHTADQPALTQNFTLVVQDSDHVHTADNVVTVFHATVVVSDGDHVHAADTPALTQHNALVAQDSDHLHDAEAPALTQHHVLVVSDGDHTHTADVVMLSISVSPADGDHVHTSDTPSLTQHHVLVVADSDHIHVPDEVTVSAGTVTLTVQDSAHLNVPDTPALTQHNVLVVADGDHVHVPDTVTLQGLGDMAIATETFHISTSDEVALTQHHTLQVDDIFHAFDAFLVGIIRTSNVGVAPPERRKKENKSQDRNLPSTPKVRREKVIKPIGTGKAFARPTLEAQNFREQQDENEDKLPRPTRGMEQFIDEAEQLRREQEARQLRDDAIERRYKKTGEILQGEELSRNITGEKLLQAKAAHQKEKEQTRKQQLRNLAKARRALARKRKK